MKPAPIHWLLLLALLTSPALTTQAQTIRYVSPTGPNTNPATATSWATSTTNLQGAINASVAGDQVWVKAGIYKPTTTTARTVSFAMKNSVAIYGGFAGTETTLTARPAVNLTTPSATTLSGDIGTIGSTTDNSYHVISNPAGLITTAVLDGFVITGGNADGSFPNNSGGGMYNDGSGSNFCNPLIRNCLFQANRAVLGGAIYNNGRTSGNCSPVFTTCSFQNNTASSDGGAIYNDGYFSGNSSPALNRCFFQNNSAASGGAMYHAGGNALLTNTSFIQNSAPTNGGGAIYYDGNAVTTRSTLANVSFTNNAGGDAVRTFAMLARYPA